ncbi:hypothetical protein QVD17_27344 [Tagetes erecta]|uniref:Uncharacterized protein n=1 Tax=Tagetes erecta TaxID=13708 RepID=A0AAD8NRK8_TARER|nr:hypothetical protein QVD17_27344 [Tagetes erecta]
MGRAIDGRAAKRVENDDDDDDDDGGGCNCSIVHTQSSSNRRSKDIAVAILSLADQIHRQSRSLRSSASLRIFEASSKPALRFLGK